MKERNESAYQIEISENAAGVRPLSTGIKDFKHVRHQIEEQTEEESVRSDEMYKIYDCEDGNYVDIRELEKDLYVTDSTTYFDKRQALKFTTISLKSKFRTMWADFWAKKDSNNNKLISAAATGDLKTI